MKLKDFLKNIADQAQIKDSDFETVLAASALADVDIPDKFNAEFLSKYLTKDRALNDPSIVGELQKKFNKTAFDAFDEKITGFLDLIDTEDVDKIKGTKETYEKYDILKAGLKKMKAKTPKGGVNEDANKILEEKNNEIKTLRDGYEAKLKLQNENLQDIAASSVLTSKILAFNFADAFKPLKDSLAELTVNKVKQAGYKLALDKGALKIYQKVNDSDSWVEAFEGNEKLTPEKLLTKELDPYIAKANTADQTQQRTEATVTTGKLNPNTMTLDQMRKAAFAQG